MIISHSEFLAKVMQAPIGIIVVTEDPEEIKLQITNGVDDEIRETLTADGPECCGPVMWAEFKKTLGGLLSTPHIYSRIAVFDGRQVVGTDGGPNPLLKE